MLVVLGVSDSACDLNRLQKSTYCSDSSVFLLFFFCNFP